MVPAAQRIDRPNRRVVGDPESIGLVPWFEDHSNQPLLGLGAGDVLIWVPLIEPGIERLAWQKASKVIQETTLIHIDQTVLDSTSIAAYNRDAATH